MATEKTVTAEAAVVPSSVDKAARAEAHELVEQWQRDKLGNSEFSAHTAALNHFLLAKEDLKDRIAAVLASKR